MYAVWNSDMLSWCATRGPLSWICRRWQILWLLGRGVLHWEWHTSHRLESNKMYAVCMRNATARLCHQSQSLQPDWWARKCKFTASREFLNLCLPSLASSGVGIQCPCFPYFPCFPYYIKSPMQFYFLSIYFHLRGAQENGVSTEERNFKWSLTIFWCINRFLNSSFVMAIVLIWSHEFLWGEWREERAQERGIWWKGSRGR
jgi:hypothetical protein